MTKKDDLIDVTELVEAFSKERLEICFERALKEYKGTATTFEELENDEEFLKLYEFELKAMAANDIMEELMLKGFVEVESINLDGELCYNLTETGRQMLDNAET